MSDSVQGTPHPAIATALNQGWVIPFLGAGASIVEPRPKEWKEGERHPPLADDLAAYLGKKTKFPVGEKVELTAVAQYYRKLLGPKLLKFQLHQVFNRDYPLGTIHTHLASIEVPLLIITTNYDDLIERAFDAVKRPYDLLVHPTALGKLLLLRRHGEDQAKEVHSNKVPIDLSDRTVIFKMHGSIDRSKSKGVGDHYVITEDDYVEFLGRMVRKTAFPAMLAAEFLERSFLFLGYGLRDWNLRLVLNQVDQELKRQRRGDEAIGWAIDAFMSALDRWIWDKRGVYVFQEAVEDFAKRLEATEP